MSGAQGSPLGWLHLSRPRENWHKLDAAEHDRLYEKFAEIRQATAADGATIFGPYSTEGYGEWSRYVYFEFPDLSSLFRLEERLQEIDYMSLVDFENHLGRVYSGHQAGDARGKQPYCVVALAQHDDAWYTKSNAERQRIEREEILPSLSPIAAGEGGFIALASCDITMGPQQYFLWEAPTLDFIYAARPHLNTFWRYHRGARMIPGRKSER
jgi:hypothetical protein